jgi:hypothetical protein
MSKMSYIAYLCEQDDKEGLINELNTSGLTKLADKTVEEVADGFIKAYNNIRLQKNNPAFEKLNEIQDEMLKFVNKGDKNENK